MMLLLLLNNYSPYVNGSEQFTGQWPMGSLPKFE